MKGRRIKMMKLWQKNLILMAIVILLAAAPLIFLQNAAFSGADGNAEQVINEVSPEYKPWFKPIIEPASGEIESLLFALQAAVGGIVIGFVFGRLTAKPKRNEKDANN